jgi:hypothetical protein
MEDVAEAQFVFNPRTEKENRTVYRFWKLTLQVRRIPTTLMKQYRALPSLNCPPGSYEIVDEIWKRYH